MKQDPRSPRTQVLLALLPFGLGLALASAGFLAFDWLNVGPVRSAARPRGPDAGEPASTPDLRAPPADVASRALATRDPQPHPSGADEPFGGTPDGDRTLAEALARIDALEQEVARLQALLDSHDELRALYRKSLEEQGLRHTDAYAALLDFVRHPERIHDDPGAVLRWVDTVVMRTNLHAIRPMYGDDNLAEWNVILEEHLEDPNHLIAQWDAFKRTAMVDGELVDQGVESIMFQVNLPYIPNPEGWEDVYVDEAYVTTLVERYDDGGWSCRLEVSGGEGGEVTVQYDPEYGYEVSREPVRGGSTYREARGLDEPLRRLLLPFQELFHRYASTLRR